MKSERQREIRVLIIDDHPVVREGLRQRIARERGMKVCGEADNINDGIKLVAELKPAVAVIDIGLQESDGLELVERIKMRGSKVKVLVWSMYAENHFADRALRAGALGYLTKDQPTDEVIRGIDQVAQGKYFLSPSMQERLLRRLGTEKKEVEVDLLGGLTNREFEVFRLIGQAMDTRAIAEALHLSPKTVETYQAKIKEKLRLNSIRELVGSAVRWRGFAGKNDEAVN